MPASKAELWDQLSKAIKIHDTLFQGLATDTPSFLSNLDSLQQAYEGSHIGTTESLFSAMRSSLSTIVGQYSHLEPIIIELAKQGYDSVATDSDAALVDIAAGMDSGSETVKERDWTHGSVTAGGSNAGSGTIYRCVYDVFGNVIEAGAANGGVVKIEISLDKNLGRESGQEQAQIYGSGTTPTDNLELGDAPGETASLTAYRSDDGILSNGNFSDYDGTGGSDITFTDWTLNSSTNATVDTSIYFRKNTDGTDGVSLEFTANNNITQYFVDLSGDIDPALPVFLIVRYRRKSSCDGTLTIRLGSKTETQTLSSVSDATWYDLVLGVSDSDGYYKNFKEDSGGYGARVQIDLSSRTTGSLLVGEVILAQPIEFDGKYYLMTAGATDFLKGDYFTFTDSVSNTGRIQYTLSQLFGRYLPHTSGTPTYADA